MPHPNLDEETPSPYFQRWVASTVILGPDNLVPLVMDLKKNPRVWKFPGGHNEPGETETETAIRETEEETGLIVTDLRPLGYHPGEKPSYLFLSRTDSFDTLKKRGDDGERVRIFPVSRLLALTNFHGLHRQLLLQGEDIVL
jgi:8-oxo-dGTP pyrophosphatase MutT (NUDIX family)